MMSYLIFVGSMAFAVICISYDSIARAKGWPVGEVLSNDASLPKIIALITAIWILAKSFLVLEWWSPFAILALGWFIAFILTMALRKHVQFLGILGVFPALFFTIIYISESKPFGMLYSMFS